MELADFVTRSQLGEPQWRCVVEVVVRSPAKRNMHWSLVISALFIFSELPTTHSFAPSAVFLRSAGQGTVSPRLPVVRSGTFSNPASTGVRVARKPTLCASGGEANSQSDQENPAAPSPSGIAFREGDVQVFLDMAQAEEEKGNTTGAEMYRSMAGNLEKVMKSKGPGKAVKVQAKMKVEESQEERPEPNAWPFAHSGLVAKGSGVSRTAGGTKPSTARTRIARSPGEKLVTWKVKVEQRKGPLQIGLTSLMVDLDSDWSDPRFTNQAYYMSQSGTLYNGDQTVASTSKAIEAGDVVEVTLDGDALCFSVNGEELPAVIKPVVTSSLRFSVNLRTEGDAMTFLGEEERDYATEDSGYGTSTISRSSIDDDEDGALLAEILSTKQPKNKVVKAPKITKSPWKMAVEQESGSVYYWNTKTQETTWDRPADFVGASEQTFLEEERKAGSLLKQAEEDRTSVMFNNQDGKLESHQAVTLDADGFPVVERFVFVDEQTCIGCTNCATVARSTFFMEPSHGRARAFRQGGDSDSVIEEAVDTCPVDCIWYVSWEDLVVLEQERREQVIDPFARLMGGNFIESVGRVNKNGGGASKASIMNSGKMRCTNCPGRGCKDCPLYGVGENPEFRRKKAARDRRRKMRKGARMDADGGGTKLKLSDDGFMNEEATLNSINTWDESELSSGSSEWSTTQSRTEDDKSV